MDPQGPSGPLTQELHPAADIRGDFIAIKMASGDIEFGPNRAELHTTLMKFWMLGSRLGDRQFLICG